MERSNSKPKLSGNPYDINGAHFNPDMYLQKLFKDHSLKEIMEQEENVVRDTQTLHSEMQTLVYENYNKFISATDTIRKMKNDFKQMETEMDLLGKNMDSITSFSDQISHTLQDTRLQISKLSGIHSLLKRLQFLYKLPNKLKTLMEERNYKQAVDDYVHTQQVLHHYAHLESFRGIQNDCMEIVEQIKKKLYLQFESKQATPKEVAESVDLLLLLGEPPESLYQEFLSHASARLDDRLLLLESTDEKQDLIELVDMANNEFLGDLCLIVTSYRDMFLSGKNTCEGGATAGGELEEWVCSRMSKFLAWVERRALSGTDSPVLLRALDRLYTCLGPTVPLLGYDFTRQVVEIGIECGQAECCRRKAELSEQLTERLRKVRQTLSDEPSQAGQLLDSLILETIDAVNTVLSHLKVFTKSESRLCSEQKLQECFASSLQDTLLVGFLRDTAALARSFLTTTTSLPVLLLLSKMCLEFANHHVKNLLAAVDVTEDEVGERLSKEMRSAAQELGDHYVRMQGNIIGQMLRKSVETRDWAHSLEPRSVRPVMRRVLEELVSAKPVVALFEEPALVAPPGSGSRHHARSSTGLSWADHGYSHSLHKLFSDKIEIFTPIEFTKTSIFTGIIKISLKTFLECVRLRTFSKFGLQQIQVDVHFLQLFLWQFVSDENLIQTLLDDILGSTVQRCLEPALMEPSVVDIICERG